MPQDLKAPPFCEYNWSEHKIQGRTILAPAHWSEQAVGIVAGQYLVDDEGVPELLARVLRPIADAGAKAGYFADAEEFFCRLVRIVIEQRASFNSPVWYNVGRQEHPQCSACFINSVEDSMESIMDLARLEATLFKGGSGTGTNFSTLRASHERLSSGGTASGPVSFMRGFDAFAGIVRCVTGDTFVWTDKGGSCIANLDSTKRCEIATGKGYEPVSGYYQNSVMAVKQVSLKYTGIQLTGTGNHPLLSLTHDGFTWKTIDELTPGDPVAVARGFWPDLKDGLLNYQETVRPQSRKKYYVIPTTMSPELGLLLGLLCADGSIGADRVRYTESEVDAVNTFCDTWQVVFGYRPVPHYSESKHCWDVSSSCLDIVRLFLFLGLRSPAGTKEVPAVVFRSSRETAQAFVRGYFEGDGHNGVNIVAVSKSKKMRDQIQQLLLALGFVSRAYTNINGYYCIQFGGETAKKYRDEIGFLSALKKRSKGSLVNRKNNTNIDVIPGIVNSIRRLSTGCGWYCDPNGKRRQHGLRFFNRISSNVAVSWFREHQDTVNHIAVVSPAWHSVVTETLKHNYFWDTVVAIEPAVDEVTYDVAVENEHSFVGNGIICHNSGGKTRRAAKMVILDVAHPDIEEFLWCKAKEERKAKALAAAGYPTTVGAPSVFFQNANNSVRVNDAFMRAAASGEKWHTEERVTHYLNTGISADGLLTEMAEAAWECGDPAVQFDDEINQWNTCAADGRINASNPCSEFMFLDNTACNLASINLVPFLTDKGDFDIMRFVQIVQTMIIAQDILVEMAGYPTGKIAHNARQYRPLGLGFTNLGAALMRLGLPYDSADAREWAACVTALMTGAAYATSARMGRSLGAFSRLEANQKHCSAVIETHMNNLRDLSMDVDHVRKPLADAAWPEWSSIYPETLRNSQVTLLAPTGTISFMMDCDTTGIEPAMALVHTKKLADGRALKMVNRSVVPALVKVGCNPKKAQEIATRLAAGESFAQASAGEPSSYAAKVLQCAFPDADGHCVSVNGHLDMMAAVQPFLSGAISKTVNMPATATIEDVKRVFVRAWKLGLKSVAIYRDGSKAVQPVTTQPTPAVVVPAVPVGQATTSRQKMPKTRKSITHKFSISGHKGYLTVGLYPDGRPGEVFLHMAKAGSLLSGMADAWAVALSFGLQYGVPLEAFVKKFAYTHFEPAGLTGDEQVRTASSVVDYVVRWLQVQFAGEQGRPATDQPVLPPPSETRWCLECGAEMARTGVCWACPTCGSSTGCG